MMRALVWGTLLVALAAARAGATDPLDAQIADLRKAVREDRVTVVKQALPLSAEEASVFWPLYLEHQAALDDVRDRRLQFVLEFLEQASSMDDESAGAMVLQALDVKRDLVDVDRTWMVKMMTVLPPRKVLRYFQVENKIDALVNVELAAVVPLTPAEAIAPAAVAPAKP